MRAKFAILFVTLCAWAVACATASATVVHPLVSSFGFGETPEAFLLPTNLAVDNSSSASANHVYVGGFLSSAINELSGMGTYDCQITGAGSTSGKPVSSSECDGGSAGLPSGAFGSLVQGGLAVNNSGDLYVGDVTNDVVDEFGPTGDYLSAIALPKAGTPRALAIDAEGNVFIVDSHNSLVYKYDVSTSTLGVFASEGPMGDLRELLGVAVDDDPTSVAYGDVYVTSQGAHGVLVYNSEGVYKSELSAGVSDPSFGVFGPVSVDPTSGDVYVSTGSGFDEFDANGVFLSRIPLPEGAVAFDVSINAETGDIYVPLFFEGAVDIFGPATIVPTVATVTPSNVQPTGVTLEGTADPAGGGAVTDCQFEWGESTSYGNTEACLPSTPYTGITEVNSGSISGLTPDTTYHYRLTATNANGTEHSEDRTFEATGAPTLAGETVTETEQMGVTLQAQINPHGFETTYQVEYGLCTGTCQTTYEASVPVPAATLGAGMTASTVSQKIGGLTLDRKYHYRFVATNPQGPTVDGEDQTFSTSPAAVVENVTETADARDATIKARVNPYGEDTSCRMQYVNEAEYQGSGFAQATTLPCSPAMIAGGSGPHNVIVQMEGLAIDTVYRYRFLAVNDSGETTGPEGTVATFGIPAFTVAMQDGNGGSFTQAGGHPYDLMTNIVFAQTADGNGEFTASGNVKDVKVALPAGLVGNPSATATCTRHESERKQCSGAAQVGTIVVHALTGEIEAPVFNIAPPVGVAAELGARINNFVNTFIDASARTGGDYGIDTDSLNITGFQGVRQVTVDIWGVPGMSSHDGERACPKKGVSGYEIPCATPERAPLRPFLTAPGFCPGGKLSAGVWADAYQEPGVFVESRMEMPGVTGCGELRFEPGLEAQPTSTLADSPSGLDVDLHVPQPEGCTEVGGKVECEDAEAELRNATVTLPAGIAINPSSADGLEACSEEQIGYLPQKSAEVGHPQFTSGPAECPDASKVGSVEVNTPLIGHPLPGAVYVAAQDANPFKSLLALYITVHDVQSGVVVKLPAKVALDPVSGRLTATVDEDPQLPFNDFKLDFFSGSRAALTTPFVCGSYAVGSDLSPWSAPEGEDAEPSSLPFTVSGAPGGAACVSSEAQAPDAPGFEAGTVSPVAGSYSPFVLRLKREDASQRFSGLNVTLPRGLVGRIAGVQQCSQAAIEAAQARGREGEGALELAHPSCPAGSEVGVVHVGAGSGTPYYVGGHAYFAGPYKGAPFSIVIVTPAVAGPFDLGTVVVRAALFVDRSTAQVTVKSDPFPTILDGIPLDIRSVDVDMNRNEFTLNPTSCDVMAVSGEEQSTAGQVAGLSSRFQVGGCTTLPFQPSFTASTQGATSKADGASLTVKVAPPAGEANIAKVDLQLPGQLPARLPTLQKACTEAQFNANPAGCPEASFIGTATARTPILASPLTGPAILVSHGSSGWPDVELVLQAEGVEIVLDGATQIKNDITYSKFEAVPDAPISSFETTLPEGPHSVLGTDRVGRATSSLCGQKLEMPTTITGQNGVVVKQTTDIAVTGCASVKTKPVGRAQKLAVALKRCRSQFKGRGRRGRRAACEKAARGRLGSHPKTKRAKKKK